MRLATWNVNSLTARLERVEEWMVTRAPDVLCLQETKQTDDAFPEQVFADLGYASVHHGQGRWNGVAIISRVGLVDPVSGFGTNEDEQGARLVSATCDSVRVMSAYVPNGRSLDSEHYVGKLRWLDELIDTVSTTQAEDAVALCGDFNVAPRDQDVWDMSALQGMTHVSEPERARIAALGDLGFADIVATEHPDGGVFSWWDYRAGAFHKGHGMRIDLVLTSAALSPRVTGTFIDRDARKGPKPSDHAPVVVDIT